MRPTSRVSRRDERNLDVGLGKTLTVNLTLKIGGLTESIDVVTNASTIDLTSPSTETSISQDLLQLDAAEHRHVQHGDRSS